MLIAVDVDDVLGELLVSLIAFHNKRHGTSFKKEDHHDYDLTKIWGMDSASVRKIVYDFYETKTCHELDLMEGAQEAVRVLSQHHELVVMTSRPTTQESVTRRWITKHFPGMFKEVYVLNHFSEEGGKISKADLCKKIGAFLLIDDGLHNVMDEEVPAFLMDQPWNQVDELPPHITRVFGWKDVVEKLNLVND